jgi:hypothetical protein
MRVHGNQVDSNFELNALYAAAKTEAKLEAEGVRKRLSLAGDQGDAADCVVSLSGEGAPGEEAQQQEAQGEGEAKADQSSGAEGGDEAFSDWA